MRYNLRATFRRYLVFNDLLESTALSMDGMDYVNVLETNFAWFFHDDVYLPCNIGNSPRFSN